MFLRFGEKKKTLLVFNTHLDPHGPENQKKQLQEIYNFIGVTLDTILAIPHFNPASCGVLLCGDFNIVAHSTLYQEVLETIFHNCFRDIYAEYCKNFLVEEDMTYEDANTLAAGGDYRLDFILGMDKYICVEQMEKNLVFMKLWACEAKVDKQEKGNEMSDHWPVSVKLMFEENREKK